VKCRLDYLPIRLYPLPQGIEASKIKRAVSGFPTQDDPLVVNRGGWEKDSEGEEKIAMSNGSDSRQRVRVGREPGERGIKKHEHNQNNTHAMSSAVVVDSNDRGK
jgi:hypothetical protein